MILILTQCFPSRLGGIESLVSNLALSLAKKEKVIVYADHHHTLNDAIFDNEHKNEILIRRVGGFKFLRRRKKIMKIKPYIESKKVKLVIGDSWKSLELAIDYLNLNNIPTVCLAHGNEFLSTKSSKIERIKNILQKISLVIANSQYTSNLVKNLNIPDIKIDYVYPGATDLRNEDPIEVPNIKGNPTILTLGRIEKRKGHSYVINCVKKLLSKYPNIKYIIAGEGPEKKELEKMVLNNNLSKNIIFVGKVNNSQKKFIFEITDLMIMPTIDESIKNSIEGFGIVYLEAAFFSIPSIASNVGGTSEAVINNLTGIVIDNIDNLYDTMLKLLDNKAKKINLGKAAKERALRDFKWEIIIEKYLLIFNRNNII